MNVHVTQFADGLPRRGFSVADVVRMVDLGLIDPDERFELLDGEIVPMAAKSIRHELLKNWIDRELTLALGRTLGVGSENDMVLSHWTFVVPDILVHDYEADMESMNPDNVRLAIEVAVTSLAFDRGRKAKLYAACGVRELWVVDAATLTTYVFRDPTGDGFATEAEFAADVPVTPQRIDVTLRMQDFEDG